MADRYWVGGTGTWDGTNTTNWSATSGGAGGASVPTSADNVIFNGSSDSAGNPFTVTVGSARSCLDFTASSLDSAMTLAGSNNLTIERSLSLPATNFTWSHTGNLFFQGSNAGTVNTNGVTLSSNIFISKSPSTQTLQAALTTTGSFTLSVGTIDLANFSLTCGSFVNTGSSTRTIAFGTTGSISLTGSGSVWDSTITTGFTFTGTSDVRLTNSGSTATSITTGSLSASQALNFSVTSGTYTLTLGAGGVFRNLNFTGFSGLFSIAAISPTISGDITFTNTMTTSRTTGVLTFSGTCTITSNALTLALPITFSSGTLQLVDNLSITGAFTMTGNTTLTLNSNTLTVTSFVSASGTRVFAFGTGSITTTGTGTVWNISSTSSLSYTGTPNVIISNNTSTAVTIVHAGSAAGVAFNFSFINGTYALTLTSGGTFKDLNFTGFAGTASLSNSTYIIHGNLNLGSTAGISGLAGNTNFTWNSTSGTRTITTNGRTVSFGIALNGVGQTLQLADAFVQGTTHNFAYTNGTLDLAGYSASFGTFSITTGTHAIINGTVNATNVTHTSGNLSIGTGYLLVCSGTYTFTSGTITLNDGVDLVTGVFSSSNSNTRSVAFGALGSAIRVTGSGTNVWNVATPTSFAYTGTPLVELTFSGSTATSFTSALTAINFSITAGTYTLTIGNSTIVNNLDFTGFSGTYAQGANSLSILGNLTYSATMSTSTTAGSGFIVFTATSGTDTITTNGITVNNNIRFNGVGGTFQLASNFTQGSTSYFNIQNGTVDFNNVTYSIGVLQFSIASASYINYGGTLSAASIIHSLGTVTVGTGALISTAGNYTFTAGTITINNGVDLVVGSISTTTNTRVINFGTGRVKITGTGSATVINMATATGFSFTGTSNFTIDPANSSALSISHTGAASTALNVYVVGGTNSITIFNTSIFRTLDFTGFAGTLTVNPATIYANLILGSAMATSGVGGSSSAFTWVHTTGTQTITTNGVTANFGIVMNGTGGTLRFADNFSQGAIQVFGLTAGTIDLNSQTVSGGILTIVTGTHALTNGTLTCASVTHTTGDLTVNSSATVVCTGAYGFANGSITINNGVDLTVGSFVSANTASRSIAFGTGRLVVTGTSGTIWNTGTVTNFSYTGTSNVTLTGAGSTPVTITVGAMSAAQVLNFNITAGTYTLTTTTASAFNNLDFTGFNGTYAQAATNTSVYGNLVFSAGMSSSSTGGTLTMFPPSLTNKTITSNGNTLNLNIAISAVTISWGIILADDLTLGSARTFTFNSGGLDLNSKILTTGLFSSSNSNNRQLTYGATGRIDLSGSGTVWTTATLTGFTYVDTSTIRLINAGSTATTITTGTTTAANVAGNFYITAGTYTLTITTGSTFLSLDFTGFSGTYAQSSGAISVYGNLTYSATMNSTTTSGAISMVGFTSSITTNGATVGNSITLNRTDGTYQLADNFTQSSGARLTLTNGTLDINSKTTSAGIFTILTGTHAITNGTLTCATVNHSSGDLTVNSSATVACTGTYTFTAGTITINDGVTLSAGLFSSSNSNSRSIAFGTGKLRLTGTGLLFTTATTTGFSYTGTSRIELDNNTSTASSISPGAVSSTQIQNFYVVSGTYTLTINNGNIDNLDFTGFSGTLETTSTAVPSIHRNLTLSSGMTTTNAGGAITLIGTTDSTVTTNGAVLNQNLGISKTTVTPVVYLGDNLTSNAALSLVVGTLNTANYAINVASFNSASTTPSNRVLTLGSSAITVTGSEWNVASVVSLTSNTANITMSSSSSKTFAGGGLIYYNLIQGGSGTLTITGSNTFNDITNTTQPATVTLTSGTTQTVSNFTLSGTSGNFITLNSATPGSAATLSKSTGTVSVNYLSITDSTAIGGATWDAYYSTDGGNNSGWNFLSVVTQAITNFFAFF